MVTRWADCHCGPVQAESFLHDFTDDALRGEPGAVTRLVNAIDHYLVVIDRWRR